MQTDSLRRSRGRRYGSEYPLCPVVGRSRAYEVPPVLLIDPATHDLCHRKAALDVSMHNSTINQQRDFDGNACTRFGLIL